MRQVPQYAVIGDGQAAKHICHYFNLLKIPFFHWHRKASLSLKATMEKSSHILLLISDKAIDPFIQQNPFLSKKILVHFSGCHVSEFAQSTHPLISFSQDLYDLEKYKKIPFIIEKEGLRFNELLPGLSNPHFVISRDQKSFYHSLCVMANNFTTLLWQKFFKELDTLKIPSEHASMLLDSTLYNIKNNYKTALTGPLVRQDYATIEKNLQALRNDSFQEVYKIFVKLFEENQL